MNDRTETIPNEKTTIHQRLSAVMEDVGAVGKGERNAQQGFNFRGVDAVVKAVAPALRKHGVTVMPTLIEKSREAGTTKAGGFMETVYLTVQYTLFGPDGDSVTGIVAAQANDTADKATAKAMSVAYRTFWLQALCIPTDEPDPDLSYTERGATAVRPANPATAEQVRELLQAANTGVNMGAVMHEVLKRQATPDDLTHEEAVKLLAAVAAYQS